MKGNAVTETQSLSTTEADIGEETVLQILRVADLLTRIGNSKVFGKELTQAQFNVLMVLKRSGTDGITQRDILENLVSTKGNVSIHITNLNRMGYIRKKTSSADSRMNIINLTAKGKRILEELEPRYTQHLKKITHELVPEKAEITLQVLDYFHGKCSEALKAADSDKEGDSAK